MMNILFISLGCDKNLVDSEKMLGQLYDRGYSFTDDEQEADIIIVNTCCFIHDAKEESINTLLEMARLKETGRCKVLIAAGCLAQRYRKEIREEIPEVDGLVGTSAFDAIWQVITETLKKGRGEAFADLNRLPLSAGKRIVTTGGYYAYLKIAEGCDKHCTYCAIPGVRGGYRSVPMEELLTEAKNLASQGVRELILVAQETTLYGTDLYGNKQLPRLLRELCRIDGLVWIRILYCYPEEITDELIDVIAEEKKICHYLDIPIQHASDAVLKRMGRRTDQKQLRAVIGKLRERIPDIVLRTTLISGFPGETEEDHAEVLQFVDEMEFERLGVFPYSEEENTPAAEMPDQIPEEVREARRNAIMELQQEIVFARGEELIGQRFLVMIEGKLADEHAYIGRTYMDAPSVDGSLFVQTSKELLTGDMIAVEVTGSADYDLIGIPVDELETDR